MRFSPPAVRWPFSFAALLSVFLAAGCGSSCFVGFSNNGNGGLFISGSNPPTTCPPSQGMGTVLVSSAKSVPCEMCTKASRVEHVFVALGGIALRESGDTSTWLEIAPRLSHQPLQIDLMDSTARTQTLVANAVVPVGNYHEIRIQFSADSPIRSEEPFVASDCGKTRWNCIVAGDGHAEPLFFPDDSPGLVISTGNIENSSFLVLPDAQTKLRLTLQPQSLGYWSLATGWKLRTALVGRAASTR